MDRRKQSSYQMLHSFNEVQNKSKKDNSKYANDQNKGKRYQSPDRDSKNKKSKTSKSKEQDREEELEILFEENFDFSIPDRSHGDLFCKACDSHMNSEQMWEAHIQGKRHLKNIKKENTAEKELKYEVSIKDPEILNEIKDVKETIIGLQHCCEFQRIDAKPIYQCFMCSANVPNAKQLIEHVIGIKHRLAYLKEHDIGQYDLISKTDLKKGMIEPVVQEIIEKHFKKYGHGKMQVKVEKAKPPAPPYKKPFKDDVNKKKTNDRDKSPLRKDPFDNSRLDHHRDPRMDLFAGPRIDPYGDRRMDSYCNPRMDSYGDTRMDPYDDPRRGSFAGPNRDFFDARRNDLYLDPHIDPRKDPYIEPRRDPYIEPRKDPYSEPRKEPYIESRRFIAEDRPSRQDSSRNKFQWHKDKDPRDKGPYPPRRRSRSPSPSNRSKNEPITRAYEKTSMSLPVVTDYKHVSDLRSVLDQKKSQEASKLAHLNVFESLKDFIKELSPMPFMELVLEKLEDFNPSNDDELDVLQKIGNRMISIVMNRKMKQLTPAMLDKYYEEKQKIKEEPNIPKGLNDMISHFKTTSEPATVSNPFETTTTLSVANRSTFVPQSGTFFNNGSTNMAGMRLPSLSSRQSYTPSTSSSQSYTPSTSSSQSYTPSTSSSQSYTPSTVFQNMRANIATYLGKNY